VTVNDWCADVESGVFDLPRLKALLNAYHAVRPLLAIEHAAWPKALRAAALRFWMSRLYDFYLPRPATMLTPHDPTRFERMLALRIADPSPPWID
jgi:homoserine kinase type II